jgi:hypothetical protein
MKVALVSIGYLNTAVFNVLKECDVIVPTGPVGEQVLKYLLPDTKIEPWSISYTIPTAAQYRRRYPTSWSSEFITARNLHTLTKGTEASKKARSVLQKWRKNEAELWEVAVAIAS